MFEQNTCFPLKISYQKIRGKSKFFSFQVPKVVLVSKEGRNSFSKRQDKMSTGELAHFVMGLSYMSA